MDSQIKQVTTYLLAAWNFVNAYTSYTHGQFLPELYQFQKTHEFGDGLTIDEVSTYTNLVLGILIILPITSKIGRLLSLAWLGLGLGVQLRAGKPFIYDLVLVLLANVALSYTSGNNKIIVVDRKLTGEAGKPEVKKA